MGPSWTILMARKNRKTRNGKGHANSTKLARRLGESGICEAPVGHFGLLLKPSWSRFGPSWGYFGPARVLLGPSWVQLGPSWILLEPAWALLGSSWALLRPSWSHPGAILDHFDGTRNTGRERTRKFYEIGTAPRREHSFRGSGGCILKPLKPSSSHLGALSGPSWVILNLGRVLGGSWEGLGMVQGSRGGDREGSKTIENDRKRSGRAMGGARGGV